MIKDKQNSITRVDGRLKVTGSVRYAAEHPFPGLLYGALVNSTIAKGSIAGIDSKEAEQSPGVVAVISHLNAPKIPGYAAAQTRGNSNGIQTFNDNQVYFNGQPVVLVVANTFERAKYAASLVKVKYQAGAHQTDLIANLQNATRPGEEGDYLRGEPRAYRNAPVKIEVEYRTPIHVHNAMEPFAVTAIWDGDDKVTEYTKSQYIKGAQRNIMNLFKLPEKNVKVYSKVIGGAFGSGSGFWPHEKAALIGAKIVGKPLKVVIDREQMFTMVGYRSPAVQKIGIGATADGKLVGITHEATGETSTYQVFAEGITSTTTFLYNCPNINTQYKLARLDLSTPTYTRGPGETTGVFALESAMDELAHELKMDPLELRRKNYSKNDQSRGNMTYSSKYLDECYDRGAEKFGWNKRNPVPGSVTKDGWLVGYGMSNAVYGTHRAGSAAKARISQDGKLLVQSSTSDMGPGTATVMVQIAAGVIDIPIEDISFELGSSDLPPAPGEYGSMTTSSVGSAVYDSCVALKEKFKGLAGNGSDGKPDYIKILNDHNLPFLETTVNSAAGPDVRKYSSHAFCAHFVEVNVHPATGEVRISRVVSTVDGGTILNPITARSQIIGGVVWGIGMALMEGGVIDHRYGKYVNSNLAEYHIATNADVPQIDVLFINKKDPVVNPMGSKGIGEVAIVGFAAAVANAVFNATGKRIRELPITPDKLV